MPLNLQQWWNLDGGSKLESARVSEAIDVLERWALSLPWVEPVFNGDDGEGLRAFAVVCPPLGCDTVWLFIANEHEGEAGFEVNVVLPRKLGRRGVRLGWATQVLDLSADRVVASVGTPTTAAELSALQALLIQAYEAAF
jgi:hypothetical protein